MEKVITAPLCAIMTAALLLWLKKEGLWKTFGLCKPENPAKVYLFYLPLLILISVNLWGGVQLHMSLAETVLYMLTMVGVGILEEVIFRGLLFKAMCKDSVKWAIIVSSVTFGFGHIVNLLNGAEVLPTLLQIVYATAAGFMFVMIYLKTDSLIVCIAAHGLFNAISVFADEVRVTTEMRILTCALLTVITGAYATYLAWTMKGRNNG